MSWSKLQHINLNVACLQALGLARVDLILMHEDGRVLAFRYSKSEHEAPILASKHIGFEAKKVLKYAMSVAIPVLKNNHFVSEMYRNCEIGEEVSPKDYQRIATYLVQAYRFINRRGDSDVMGWFKQVAIGNGPELQTQNDLYGEDFLVQSASSQVQPRKNVEQFKAVFAEEHHHPDHFKVHPTVLEGESGEYFCFLVREILDWWYVDRGFPVVLSCLADEHIPPQECRLFLQGLEALRVPVPDNDEHRILFVQQLLGCLRNRAHDFVTPRSVNYLLDQVESTHPDLVSEVDRTKRAEFTRLITSIRELVKSLGQIKSPIPFLEKYVSLISEGNNQTHLRNSLCRWCTDRLLQTVQAKQIDKTLQLIILDEKRTDFLAKRIDEGKRLVSRDQMLQLIEELEAATNACYQSGNTALIVLEDSIFDVFKIWFSPHLEFRMLNTMWLPQGFYKSCEFNIFASIGSKPDSSS